MKTLSDELLSHHAQRDDQQEVWHPAQLANGALVPTVLDLFAAQVRATPDHIAVVDAKQQLRYAELDAQANQVVVHLRAHGVQPGTLVALCAERSLELMVGVLAILKAGGAYMPLDRSYPPERQALLLHDSQAAVILAQAALVAALPPHTAQVVVFEPLQQHALAAEPRHVAIAPDALAYVLYTSGSTAAKRRSDAARRAGEPYRVANTAPYLCRRRADAAVFAHQLRCVVSGNL
ncbi:MAG: AMP-binding protein [Blastochloris sp.]|nr:AMP-binding protein [Blastochloris sp.]